MPATQALTSPTVVELADYAAWDVFAEANADALIAVFGSVEFAPCNWVLADRSYAVADAMLRERDKIIGEPS